MIPPPALPDPSASPQRVGPLARWILGADRPLRQRVAGVTVVALLYVLSVLTARYAVHIGIMRPWGLSMLVHVILPVVAVLVVLVRLGWTYRADDPALILPFNAMSLIAIGGAYLAVAPADRGAVIGLVVLVVVFGLYTHTSRQALAVGVGFLLTLGLVVLVMSHLDPAYYPFDRELLRLQLVLSVLPVLGLAGWQLMRWRDRLRQQRVELREALARVQHLVTRDPLTGLYNRRHMQEKLEEALGRFDRYGESFTVALLDLDHFKQVNDRHGHAAGDDVLSAFGRLAGGVLRESDVISRWGGEEFLILFPGGVPAQAERALGRLRAQLLATRLSAHCPEMAVTFSAGLSLHLPSMTLAQTLERADRAMYRAKAGGRDRTCMDADSAASSPPASHRDQFAPE